MNIVTRAEFDSFLHTLPSEYYYVESDYFNYKGKGEVDSPLSFSWETGGAEGGNCWGDQAYWYSNGDDDGGAREKFDKNLDAVLAKFLPKITYLEANELRRLITTDSYTNTGYYGNYSNHSTITLNEDALYNFIVRKLDE